MNRTFTEFKPLTFKSQLVNGVNYFIKVRFLWHSLATEISNIVFQVKVDGDEHLHVRVHKTFQGEVTLASVQEKKKLQDEISYF